MICLWNLVKVQYYQLQVSNKIYMDVAAFINHMLVVSTKHVLKLCPAFGARDSLGLETVSVSD